MHLIILDRDGVTITPGVVEMACRVNLSATSFVRAAAALERTAQVKLSGERLRQVVEAAGRCVLKAQQEDAIVVAWHTDDCVVPNDTTGEKTRVYTGCDGVMVPIITDAEKVKRRDNVKAKRRCRGKKCKPLPPRRRGCERAGPHRTRPDPRARPRRTSVSPPRRRGRPAAALPPAAP